MYVHPIRIWILLFSIIFDCVSNLVYILGYSSKSVVGWGTYLTRVASETNGANAANPNVASTSRTINSSQVL